MGEQKSGGSSLRQGAVRVFRQLGFQVGPDGELPKHLCRELRMAVRLECSGVYERLMAAARPIMQPKATGRPPYDLRVMMRVYSFMRALGLSTQDCIGKLHCMPLLWRFCGIAAPANIPDQSTLHHFQARFETDDTSRRMLEASLRALTDGGEFHQERG